MSLISIADRAKWLSDPALQNLLGALSADGEEARIAGGAVRNVLLGEPATDIDIATTTVPDETERRAQAAGFKTIPTGKDHGTITVIVDGRPHEVTTLRSDVETDGRHARVVFGRDWQRDAERRDFTMNALYAKADGTIVDLVGGLADIESQTLRFIGDAEQRIREDYLRILRFFRFFAFYGRGRPDADGLRASARLKDGLSGLSAERVRAELLKLLAAPDPSRALLWMRQAGVLTAILPESEKWGIDAIHGLVSAERDLEWKADPLLRLEAIVPPDAARMVGLGERLRLSNAEAERLQRWALTPPLSAQTSEAAFAKMLYRGDQQGLADRLKLALSSARASASLVDAGGYSRLLRFMDSWERPTFPISGKDLMEQGAKPGKALGDALKAVEGEWVDGGFKAERGALLARATQLLGESQGQ